MKHLPIMRSYLLPPGFSKIWKVAFTSLDWVNCGRFIPVTSTLFLVVKVLVRVSQVALLFIIVLYKCTILWTPERIWYYPVSTSSKHIFDSFEPSHTGREKINSSRFVPPFFSVSLYDYLFNGINLYIWSEYWDIGIKCGLRLTFKFSIMSFSLYVEWPFI